MGKVYGIDASDKDGIYAVFKVDEDPGFKDEEWNEADTRNSSSAMNSWDNEARDKADSDLLRRKLDCSMINWLCDVMEKDQSKLFDSVRGMFQEAQPVFNGLSIFLKSHIQLAIRNTSCILGYFRPT